MNDNLLEAPKDWIGQMRITHLPFMSEDEAQRAQKALFKAYIQVQQNLNQPSKDQQGYGYKYANLNGVLTAIQTASKDLDIGYMQQPISANAAKTGVHNYLLNSLGAIIDFGAYVIDLSSPKPQDNGSILTYTRRYSIMAIFGVATEEDDDDAQRFEAKPEFMSPKEVSTIKVVYNGKRRDLVEVAALAMAGDATAQDILKDKNNPVKTKLAIKSLTKMYDFSKIVNKKKDAEKTRLTKEAEKEAAKEKAVGKIMQKPKDPESKATKSTNEVKTQQTDVFDSILGG